MNSKGFIATSILYGIVAMLFACFMFVLANNRIQVLHNRQIAEMVKNDIQSTKSYFKEVKVENLNKKGFDIYLYGVRNINGVANIQFGTISYYYNNPAMVNEYRNFMYNYSGAWNSNVYDNFPSVPGQPSGFNGTQLDDTTWYFHYDLSDYGDPYQTDNYYNFQIVILMTDANGKIFPISEFSYILYERCFSESYANTSNCKYGHNKMQMTNNFLPR